MTALAKIQELRADLTVRFPERKEVIDGCLAAVLAGEHILLLGPPGTAKSALVRAIAQAFRGVYFERLLTKFSTPDELFGPVSLVGLQHDRFTRIVTGKLPEAEFGFVDEVFKGSSAILNTMLTLVNEKVFHNDGTPMNCPIVSLFGASNELPEGKELEALFDRFLMRFNVDYVLRPSSFRAILRAPEPIPAVSLSMDLLREAQDQAAKVTITDETIQALIAIRDACRAEGIIASDRRWKKTLKAVQATAYLAGEAATTPEDLLILTHALWREPKEHTKVAHLVGKLADPVSAQAAEILDIARDTSGKIAGLRTTVDRKEFVAQAAQALEDFTAQQKRLEDLAKAAGTRAKQTISEARQEIAQLHSDLARTLTAGLGIGAQ